MVISELILMHMSQTGSQVFTTIDYSNMEDQIACTQRCLQYVFSVLIFYTPNNSTIQQLALSLWYNCICYSCNMSMRALPEIYARQPEGIHSGKAQVPMLLG